MHFDWPTFALQTVNFAILVWLLNRFLYKPVLRLIDARRAEIAKEYAAARTAESRAKEQLAEIAAEHAGIAAERAAVLKEAAAEAERGSSARRAAAEHEAGELLDNAHKALDRERHQALAEARLVALDLGTDIARRLLAELSIETRANAWCDRIAQYLRDLPPVEREALADQLHEGATLSVVTAVALPAEAAEEWRVRLQHVLGNETRVEFAVDPGLIAGADLHFPNAVLHFSWRDSLAAMRAELADDAEHR